MSIVKRKAGSKDIVKSVLEFDAVPTEGSHNLVESGAVSQAIGNLGQPLQWKGSATVTQLNTGITGIQPGWTYTLTDSGTLTDGSIDVEAGDEVAWTEDDEWFQVGPSLVELKADVVQAKSDIADIQDVVPEEASESNKLVTKDELDNVQESIQSGFTPKGEISVSDLNDLTTQSNGDQYILTDSGTITDGSVTVEAGDSVAWNSTDSVWYKVKQYALSKYGTDEIKNLQTSITSFRTGDVIPVDGPDGTAKMSKDDLLKEAAQSALGSIHSLSSTATDFASDDYIALDGATNGSRKMAKNTLLQIASQYALAGNEAPAFDESGNTSYSYGTPVIHGGKLYIFKVDHSGLWSSADVMNIPMSSIFATGEVLQRLAGNRLDGEFTIAGRHVGTGGEVLNDAYFGDSGLCPCIPGETLYFWKDYGADPNQFWNTVCYYDIDGKFVSSRINSDTIRMDIVPNNAYFFSVPVRYTDGVPAKIVVANFLPNKFIPYFSSHDKISKVVDDSFDPDNLFNPNTTTDGSYISSISGGTEVWTTDASIGMSDYISVKNGLLFSWFDYSTTNKDRWRAVYYVTYDSNKDPIARHYVGSGTPQIILLDSGTAYIRLQFNIVSKNMIAVGHYAFRRFVPYGGFKNLTDRDIAQTTGSSEDLVMSQKAVTVALGNVGTEPDTFDLDVTGCETDVLSTARNYILKEYTENSTRYFEFSNDNGKTFTKVQNTIGQINFVHFFSTGRVLICSPTKVYYTDDFYSFTETSVYDYDGTAFVPNSNHFYRSGNYNSEYNKLNGKEVLIWNDYCDATGYKSRVWMTDDYGVTLRCILKDEETLDTDGNVIDVSHFHRTYLDTDGKLWITSGDYNTLCKLLVGTENNGVWSWDLIGSGEKYKLGQLMIKKPYAYIITDYTNGTDKTGLVACPIDKLDNPDNFRYLYQTDNNEPLMKYFEDDNGYRVIIPDSAIVRKFWFAKGSFEFTKLSVIGGTGNIVLGNMIGPSYSNQVITLTHSNGYSFAHDPSLSEHQRYDFTKMMKNVGYKNFGKIRKFFDRLQ